MKLLFENWRHFLNEKLMLKPGPQGWDLYADLVGSAYLAAPKFESRAASSFEALTCLSSRFSVEGYIIVDKELVQGG